MATKPAVPPIRMLVRWEVDFRTDMPTVVRLLLTDHEGKVERYALTQKHLLLLSQRLGEAYEKLPKPS